MGAVTAICAVATLGAASASAAALTVTTTTDELSPNDGTCSLREAIAAANAPGTAGDCGTASGSGGNTIVLAAAHYPLSFHPTGGDDNTTGDLNVGGASGLTISGAGPTATVIDATGLGDRVLSIGNTATVALIGLTVTGGHASDGSPGSAGSAATGTSNGGAGGQGFPGEDGGGIFNDGSLTLTDVAVTGNHAGDGGPGGAGGCSCAGGGTTGGSGGNGGSGNAGGTGGGIFNNAGTLTLDRSTISGNSAGNGGAGGAGGEASYQPGHSGAGGAGGAGPEDGGGLSNDSGTVVVTASTIASNHAGAGGAGGAGPPGEFTASGGNGGNGGNGSWGGGISSVGGSLSVTNSTVTADTAGAGGNGGQGGEGGNTGNGGNGGSGGNAGDGGGVRVTSGASVLLQSTVANDAPGTPGAGASGGLADAGNGTSGTSGTGGSAGGAGAGGEIFVQGTTMNLENGIVSGNGAGGDCFGPLSAAGHLDISFGDTTCPGMGGDPKLGPLQDNGGPTQTMALGSGSAALDQLPALGSDCPPADQRGVTRPQHAGCDLGAYEVAPPLAITGDATAIGTTAATVGGTLTANAGDASVHFDIGTTSAYGAQTPIQHVRGVTPVAVSAVVGGLSPSTTYHYRLVITSMDGSATGSDRTFTTGAAGPGTGVVPRLGKIRLRPAAFAAAGRGASIAAAHRTGTTVAYTDTEAATTTFVVLRPRPGARIGKKCVKPSKRTRRRHARHCTRYVAVGSFSHVDNMGANSFHFTGRVHRRKLNIGRYRLAATPRLNRTTGRTVRTGFRITRR